MSTTPPPAREPIVLEDRGSHGVYVHVGSLREVRASLRSHSGQSQVEGDESRLQRPAVSTLIRLN
jgi:hypothetical protein